LNKGGRKLQFETKGTRYQSVELKGNPGEFKSAKRKGEKGKQRGCSFQERTPQPFRGRQGQKIRRQEKQKKNEDEKKEWRGRFWWWGGKRAGGQKV